MELMIGVVIGVLIGIFFTATVAAGKYTDEQMEEWFHDDS